MSSSAKDVVRGSIVSAVVSLGVSLVTACVALPNNGSQASAEGQRGFWSTQQKAQAAQTLTGASVGESPGKAQCMVAQLSQDYTFSEFLEYATMARQDDFSNPGRTQKSIINSLMYDAMVCPQKN